MSLAVGQQEETLSMVMSTMKDWVVIDERESGSSSAPVSARVLRDFEMTLINNALLKSWLLESPV